MSRHYYVILFLCILSDLLLLVDNSVIKVNTRSNAVDVLNNVLVKILEKCDLGLKSIFIHDNSETLPTVTALSAADLPTSLILRETKSFEENYKQHNPTGIYGFILVLNTDNIMQSLALSMTNMIYKWSCTKNCTIIIIPYPQVGCIDILNILEAMVLNQIMKTYLLCFENEVPYIVTTDIFGHSKPSNWRMFSQKFNINIGRLWTIYYRQYREDNICTGFDFERTDPITHDSFALGVVEYVSETQLNAQNKDHYSGYYRNELPFYIKDRVQNLEKLLNIRFVYFVVPYSIKANMRPVFDIMTAETVDVIFLEMVLSQTVPLMDYSYPLSYIPCSILSHDRGLSSPLQKIAAFYGFWTLLSMIVILIITFIVIWFKTKKTSAAVFDLVRLLVNTEMLVPMNTLPLRIFFLLIFLYFLIIHATLSGNLSKFLTIPASLDNINTLTDLKRPEISKIYVVGCAIPELIYDDQLARKTVQTYHSNICIDKTVADPNSVCVSGTTAFMEKIASGLSKVKLHISKNSYPGMTHAIGYRQGFVLRDSLDWGIMVLSETSTLNRLKVDSSYNATVKYKKYKLKLEITFRPISLKDLTFAFIFLAVGNILGIFCFLIEICVYQRNNIKIPFINLRKRFGNQKKKPGMKILKISVNPKYRENKSTTK